MKKFLIKYGLKYIEWCEFFGKGLGMGIAVFMPLAIIYYLLGLIPGW